jgi:hypothetical protein
MAYNFADLKTKLKSQVGDANLDDTQAGDAINDAQQGIFNMFDLTLNSDTQTNAVATGANTLTTAEPSDLQRIYGLYITSPLGYAKDLTDYYMSPKDFRTMHPDAGTYSGTLGDWTYFTSVEFAYNSPDDLVVKMDYIKSVPLLSATTDVPTIPEAFGELLMVGAKIRIFENKEDFDYAGQFTNRYADLLEAFITRYGMRRVDNQVVVSGSMGRTHRGR